MTSTKSSGTMPFKWESLSDPEADDWLPPTIRPTNELVENTVNWGPFYFYWGELGQRFPFAIAVTREIHPPWRVGVGIGVKIEWLCGFAIGIWKRGKAPAMLAAQPAERDFHTVVERANRLDSMHS